MESHRYSPPTSAEIVEIFIECGKSYKKFGSRWREAHGGRAKIPARNTVLRMMTKFRQTGNLASKKRERHVATAAKIVEIDEYFSQHPRTSLPKAKQDLNVSITTLHRVLRKDLKMKPYRITILHELKPADPPQRLEFCQWALDQINRDDTFLDNFWMSDEAHFHLNGRVNTWNSRIWAVENPREHVNVGLHSPRHR